MENITCKCVEVIENLSVFLVASLKELLLEIQSFVDFNLIQRNC